MFLESSPDYQHGKASARLIKQFGTAILLSTLACLCISCAGISSAVQPSTSSSNSNSKISVSPATVTISSGAQQQFAATQTSTSTTGIQTPSILWHASAGTISQNGLFTAPAVTSSTRVTVVATSTVDPSSAAVSQVTVTPPKLNKIAMSLSPSTATLSSGGRQQFSAP